MLLEKVQLFDTKKDFFNFLLLCLFILSYSLLIEYNNYKNLTQFDSAIIEAKVLKQYEKHKGAKNYQVLKLQSEKAYTFYTSQKKNFPHSVNETLQLEIYTRNISFYEYMTSFYAYTKVLKKEQKASLKKQFNTYLDSVHQDKKASHIYKALYNATQLPYELQTIFSQLGVSHLLAISGFHLGVLAMVLYLLFKLPYKFLQDRYFPYRSYKLDSFIFISITLLAYLLFLDTPPSLLRSYAMMLVGFILYERGYKIVSMQTLLLTLLLLLAFFPRVFFALGFWLSIAGVFYIFLFLISFKGLSKMMQFLLIPFWVYLMMLPYSLALFGTFSIYHPLSIFWSLLFSLFYPLSIVLHLLGFANLFDAHLDALLGLVTTPSQLEFPLQYLGVFIFLSLLSVYKRFFIWTLMLFSIFSLIYAIDKVT